MCGWIHLMTRRQERETVFQLLYETEFHTDVAPSTVYMDALAGRDIQETPYMRDTFYGVMEHRGEADELIAQHAHKWKLSRMAIVTRNILRLAVYEMLWGAVPPKAAINEALEIAKIYDDASAPAFINGILNRIAREKGLIREEAPAACGDGAQ